MDTLYIFLIVVHDVSREMSTTEDYCTYFTPTTHYCVYYMQWCYVIVYNDDVPGALDSKKPVREDYCTYLTPATHLLALRREKAEVEDALGKQKEVSLTIY